MSAKFDEGAAVKNVSLARLLDDLNREAERGIRAGPAPRERSKEEKMMEDPRDETHEKLMRYQALQAELIKTLALLHKVIEQTQNELDLELQIRFGPGEET